ncbi:hypothetical protein KSS87_008616 [Heliosperma pusillum]|nr:hypothetical protein KSS87_008616 [Heliosperma pusillum]
MKDGGRTKEIGDFISRSQLSAVDFSPFSLIEAHQTILKHGDDGGIKELQPFPLCAAVQDFRSMLHSLQLFRTTLI